MITKQVKKQPDQEFGQTPMKRKARRHWYDNEKLEILKRYDAKDLIPIKGDPLCIPDPYHANEALPIDIIERWRDTFRGLGVLQKAPETKAMEAPSIPVRACKDKGGAMGELEVAFIEVMQENHRLKLLVDVYQKKILELL